MAQVDNYLYKIVEMGASDLHICSNRRPMVRLHGEMRPLESGNLERETLESWIQEIMPAYAEKSFHETHDADFAYSLGREHRFRANIFLDHYGIGAVFRHIPKNLPTFEDILLESGAKKLCDLTKGLVLVTGPTGSGKSTTLAAMVNHINQTKPNHILTIEDPIEFVYDSQRSLVHQREVHSHTGSFSLALRSVLRQDPDIILVGEMRDAETTRMAIEAAETGHVVFGTMHTNTAYSTITRIIYQFGEEEQELIRSMLSQNLKGVICQTLLKREDGPGRVAAREIMLYTVGGANLIRENKLHQIQSTIDGGNDVGMISLNTSLVNLVKEGTITPQTAWAKTMDHKDLLSRLSRIGIHLGELEHE